MFFAGTYFLTIYRHYLRRNIPAIATVFIFHLKSYDRSVAFAVLISRVIILQSSLQHVAGKAYKWTAVLPCLDHVTTMMAGLTEILFIIILLVLFTNQSFKIIFIIK